MDRVRAVTVLGIMAAAAAIGKQFSRAQGVMLLCSMQTLRAEKAMKPISALTLVFLSLAPLFAAHADDEMMGTYINGRMERRAERTARVPDPAMDREEAIIDRQERQNRQPVDHSAPPAQQWDAPHVPYRGALPHN